MRWQVQLISRLGHAPTDFHIHIDFTSDAQRLVLFGPSGAGKTQTMMMMAGLTTPQQGKVVFHDKVLFDSAQHLHLPPRQRGLGYVFQDYALFPHLSVRQNIGFALRQGWTNPSASHTDAAVDHWLAVFQLQSVADLLPEQISGGQRQRTALARALVAQPQALLLDEPFAAMDRPLRQRLRQELLELQTELSLPMVLITHDEEDVQAFAQEVVHIDKGQVISGSIPYEQASHRV
jgi:molybdate transport system ATP-binding protein